MPIRLLIAETQACFRHPRMHKRPSIDGIITIDQLAVKGNTMPTLLQSKRPSEQRDTDAGLHETIRRRIDECPYRFIFNKVTWHYQRGRLTLRGRVPSFYLKQVIQELMRHIEQVEHIDNHVDVVSATGLSSEPRETPPWHWPRKRLNRH